MMSIERGRAVCKSGLGVPCPANTALRPSPEVAPWTMRGGELCIRVVRGGQGWDGMGVGTPAENQFATRQEPVLLKPEPSIEARQVIGSAEGLICKS